MDPGGNIPDTTRSNDFGDFEIPQRPSAPPPLAQKFPTYTFPTCQRQFLLLGQVYPLDSRLAQDAENLRPALSRLPSAIAELDRYQKNRRDIRRLAYVGTAGLAVATLGVLFGRGVLGGPASKSVAVSYGLLLVGGSVFAGLTTLRSNEEHLSRAVELHNQANPERRIELQVSTSFIF